MCPICDPVSRAFQVRNPLGTSCPRTSHSPQQPSSTSSVAAHSSTHCRRLQCREQRERGRHAAAAPEVEHMSDLMFRAVMQSAAADGPRDCPGVRRPRSSRACWLAGHSRLMFPRYSKLRLTTSSLKSSTPLASAKSSVPPTILCSQRPWSSCANVSSVYFAVKV